MMGLMRRQILENLHQVKSLLLSDVDVQILAMIDSVEHVTAAELGKSMEISTQNASNVLRTLYSKGYLMRKKFPDPTGGEIFIYWFAIRDDD